MALKRIITTGFFTGYLLGFGGKGFTADGKAFDAPDLRYPIIEPSGVTGEVVPTGKTPGGVGFFGWQRVGNLVEFR